MYPWAPHKLYSEFPNDNTLFMISCHPKVSECTIYHLHSSPYKYTKLWSFISHLSLYLSSSSELAYFFLAMALHFESCIFSSKPQIVAAKAQLSGYSNPAKWNIAQEERSSTEVYKTVGQNFMFC